MSEETPEDAEPELPTVPDRPDDVPCQVCGSARGHSRVRVPVRVTEQFPDGSTQEYIARWEHEWDLKDCPRCSGAY